MFTIAKANLTQTGDFKEQSIKEAGLFDKSISLSSKKNGLNFMDADGSLFCYARFSAKVKENLVNKTLTIEQLMAKGNISESEFEGETYYSLTLPNELRGSTPMGNVKDLAGKAKPLAKKTVTLADISSMLEI